ncbi:MAG: hypothetical protein ACI9V1_003463 [Spirosomataceae bacterium]|jgi:hypothetical protein
MTSKIWYELVNIKYGEKYLSKYISLQKRLKKIFQIITLVVSVSGILGWKYFEDYAWIAFLLIAFIQVILLIENQLIRSENEIDDIIELRSLYTKYFNKLEKLWNDSQTERLSESDSLDLYFTFRETDWESIEILDSKLDVKVYSRLKKKTEIETLKYLQTYHHNEQAT